MALVSTVHLAGLVGLNAGEGGDLRQAGPGKPIFGFFHTFWFLDWSAW